jgi:hypothetical protein
VFRVGRVAIALSALVFSLLSPLPAVAAPTIFTMLSCESVSDKACIESITATGKGGLIASVSKPSTTQILGSGKSAETYQEWVLPGFSFEGSSGNRVIPRIVYRPFGSETCNFEVCFVGLEEIQVGIEPSWLIRTEADYKNQLMDLSRRGSQTLCGEISKPELCYRAFNFDTDITFKIAMRVPVDFVSSAILGSVKNVSFIELESQKQGYKTLSVTFSPQKLQRPLFSPQVPTPMKTSEYADFEADQSNFWIVGQRSIQSAKLGKCSNIPFITVLSNSIYQDLPVWNSANQSVEVGLTAPHFTVSGQLHKGYFEATISKEMGQCLWGIDLSKQAVAQMSISYPAETGVEVLTISGRFDGKNYNLFSANFHYSSPTIAFKLVQESKPVAAALPIKKKISCIKGKVIKKVTAEKPKCPKGFKLKV